MNLRVRRPRVLLCVHGSAPQKDVSHSCFSAEMKCLFLSGSDPEEVSQDLRSADCNNLHEMDLPVLGEIRPEYMKVMCVPHPKFP